MLQFAKRNDGKLQKCYSGMFVVAIYFIHVANECVAVYPQYDKSIITGMVLTGQQGTIQLTKSWFHQFHRTGRWLVVVSVCDVVQ